MDKVIELENELVTRGSSIAIIAKDLFKIAKFVVISGMIIAGAEFAKRGYDDAQKRFYAWHQSYLSNEVIASLEGKTFEFDDKRGVAKAATAMNRDELLRALYVLNLRAEQHEATISHLKDILSFE